MSGASTTTDALLFDRYASKLSKTPSRSSPFHSPVKPRASRSHTASPHRSAGHTRSASSTLPFIGNLFSPPTSSLSPASSPSSPSMKHTRTMMRAERPRPRATGIRWHELTSKFDVGKVDAAVQAEDLQWRQRVIKENLSEDVKAIEVHLLLLLDRPSHPLHTFAHHFIHAFTTHYTPLLSLSSKLSADLLYYAVTELDHFSACLSNLILILFPELYSRDIQETAKLTVFEYVCPYVYAVLFAIYKRKNYYKDAEFQAKLNSLQGVSIGELGVAVALRLDGSEKELREDSRKEVGERLSTLAPPLINTSRESSGLGGSTPSSPTPSPSKERRAVTRLKTMTSFDREALKESDRAREIVEQLSFLNQTNDAIEGEVSSDKDEGEGEASVEETGKGEEDEANHSTPELPQATTRVSSLSAALKQQLKTSDRDPLGTSALSPVTSGTSSPTLSPCPVSPSATATVNLLAPLSTLAPSTSSSSTPTPHYPYHEAVLLFRRLTSSRTPRAKLSVFHLLSSQICLCVDDYYRRTNQPRPLTAQLSINADDLLSILSYILIKARLPYLISEVAFINDFVTDNLRISQLGYFLAVFEASIKLIQDLKGGGVKQHEVDDDGKAASLPSPSPVIAVSPVASSSLPAGLAHSMSTELTPTSANASPAASGDEGDGAAVLHMDMTSLLSDTSLVNNYHFAVPTPSEDEHVQVSNGNHVGGVEYQDGGASTAGGGRSSAGGVKVEEKKKKKSWLRRS